MEQLEPGGNRYNMRRKALLSVILSAVMIMGSASPACAAGLISSDEVTISTEASAPDSQDEVVIENDITVDSEQESVETQGTDEEEVGTEAGTEETGIGEETPEEYSKPETDSKDSGEEEEEKPEILVGAEGVHFSVGDNVTAGFDSRTGTVTFYSQGGTLSNRWVYELGIDQNAIKVITISDDSDIMYLPRDSSSMFKELINLESLNLSKADTSNVQNMKEMFSGCYSLQYLDVSGFNTSNVTNMSYMFYYCSSLQTLDISEFNTSNVMYMSSMFEGCHSLQRLDLSSFDMCSVNSALEMIPSGYFPGFNLLEIMTPVNVQETIYLPYTFVDASGTEYDSFPMGLSESMQLTKKGILYEQFSVGENVTAGYDSMTRTLTFYSQGGTLSRDWKTMGNISLRSIVVTGVPLLEYTIDGNTIEKITISDDSDVMYLPEDCSELFASLRFVGSIDLSKANTSNVTDMSKMFYDCWSLETLDVSGFDTSNVNSMNRMFGECMLLQRLDLSSFDMYGVNSADMMLPENYNNPQLLVILTPVNVQKEISLQYTFVDASGAEYDSLPIGRSESIRLTKKGANIPDEPENIADATVTGISNKTYTGSAQTQNPTVQLDDKTLTAGTDYTLSYANNTNAGTATVTITGKGNYIGTINKTFAINKATPTLTFAGTSITKTTQDAAFTNTLTKKTDGTVTFISSNMSVATVNSTSGKVTIKGAGTTTIKATAAAGTNYKAGSAQYILTVTKALNILSISDDFYGKTGTPASFHIEAEGSGTVNYQWQYRTAGTTGWRTPPLENAKTTDYSFKLKPSYDNIEVRCIVSDDSGTEMISETRKANVFAYTSQPKDVTAAEGEAVNFEVSAIGRGITYQWYFMRPNSSWKKATVSGSNTAVLPITASTKNDGTSYRCVITDEEGNKITSAAGLLTVDNTLRITSISNDYYGKNGESVTFHIDAAGRGDLTYQWQYKLAGETNWRTPSIASAKTADYVFKLKPAYDNIEVRCIVKDTYGNSVTSDVRKANVFAVTQHPNTVFAELGDTVTFAVEGIGQNLTYQWYYRRLEGDWKKVTAAGGNTASLTIIAQVKNNYSQYRCYVYDGLGNLIKSRAAMLIEENEEYEG